MSCFVCRTVVGHRRCVAASLVEGVYKRERARHRPEALDRSWWESFGFQLDLELYDDKDGSVFGVVYKYNSPYVTQDTPRYCKLYHYMLKYYVGSGYVQLDLHM